MPQQSEKYFDEFVSDIDYSEAQTILNLTIAKQRQRQVNLSKRLLLKRTYVHVCQLLDSECIVKKSLPIVKKSLPLAIIDTNKRKLSIDTTNDQSQAKKFRQTLDNGIQQFLQELNSIKVPARY